MSGYYDLYLNQGETFNTAINLVDVNGNYINLTNYLISGQIKKSYITSNVAATFNINVANSTAGLINMDIPYQTTQNLQPLRYVYDIIIRNTITNIATRVLEGTIYVDSSVTPSP